jgi:ABC-type molybdate transport system substrate-binding protein
MSYIGSKPADAVLETDDIADGVVTTSKLADDSVTNPKLFTGSQQNFRNIIINGDMSIAQRGTSTASITKWLLYSDRFFLGLTGAGTWTQSQSTDVPTGQGFATSLKMDNTTANGSLSAGDSCIIQQRIEGQNLQYIKKGTANAVSLTVSFWVKSNKTGTYIVELFDTDNTRQISASYTIYN